MTIYKVSKLEEPQSARRNEECRSDRQKVTNNHVAASSDSDKSSRTVGQSSRPLQFRRFKNLNETLKSEAAPVQRRTSGYSAITAKEHFSGRSPPQSAINNYSFLSIPPESGKSVERMKPASTPPVYANQALARQAKKSKFAPYVHNQKQSSSRALSSSLASDKSSSDSSTKRSELK